MRDLRTAAQKALEVLIRASSYYDTYLEIAALEAALAEPLLPPEAQTEAEKIAYCAGWWAAMQAKRDEGINPP